MSTLDLSGHFQVVMPTTCRPSIFAPTQETDRKALDLSGCLASVVVWLVRN